MESEKTPRQNRPNRVREALGRIYEHHPPYFREYLRRYQEDPKSRVFAPLAEAYRNLQNYTQWVEYDTKAMLTVEEAVPLIMDAIG